MYPETNLHHRKLWNLSHCSTTYLKTKKDQKSRSARHKKELEKYLLQEQQKRDSGFEDDRQLDSDDAVELMGKWLWKLRGF